MDNVFVWKDEYTVGVSQIDAQHMYLFDLGNRLAETPLDKSKTVVLEIFSYIRKHFTAEENHMKSINFPGLDSHKLLHDKIISNLNASIKSGLTTEKDFENFRNFIYGWLTKHIMLEDKMYFNYTNKK